MQQIDLTVNPPAPPALPTNTKIKTSDYSGWGGRATMYALKALFLLAAGSFVTLHSKQAQALLQDLGLHIDTIAVPSTGFPEHPWEVDPNSPLGSPRKWERNNGWYHIPRQGVTNPTAVEMEMQNPNGRRDGRP